MRCEPCQHELLSYLYDLLDPPERAEMAAHLEICTECRDALTAAQKHQGLLAEAVKASDVDLVFKAPAVSTPASTAATVLLHRPQRSWTLVNRWSVAAAVLFVVFSIGAGIGRSLWHAHTAVLESRQQQLARAKEKLDKTQQELDEKKSQSQKEIRAIQDEIDKLFRDWKKEETKTRKALEDKQARVGINIYGPQIAQAGAPNKYEVERSVVSNYAAPPPGMKNLENPGGKGRVGGSPAQSQARVINTKTRAVLYQQDLKFQANNRAALDLPVLPIRPGDNLAIEIQTETADGKVVQLRDNLPIVFAEFVTHLTTDRPLYRPGDTVRFRSLTLERFSLKPAKQKFHLRYRIVGPRGEEVYRNEVASRLLVGQKQEPIRGPGGQELLGLGVGEFSLPANLPPGPYTLFVSEVNERFNEEKRTFLVQRWQEPRFTKELTFHRDSYGAGDQIKMRARFTPIAPARPDAGKPLEINARVTIDGDEILKQTFRADPSGLVSLECAVPVQLQKGVGKVVLEAIDGGTRETLARDLPLIVRDLSVEFFPEGGDLIANAVNRVYFQARTPAGKPVELLGRIVDENDRLITRVQTVTDPAEPGVNQGMGVFSFTPAVRQRYRLLLDSPIGIERVFSLPDARDQGVILSVPNGVAEKEIDVVVQSVGRQRSLLVGAYCRGRVLDHQEVNVGVNQPVRVTLKPALGVGGVYRITVFEKLGPGTTHLRPLAERLIYRKRTASLSVAIKSDKGFYHPGEPVRLSLEARNEKRVLAPSVALVAVVDATLLDLAAEKTARALPTHFLLTTEVRNPEDLENADFFLSKHPRAPESLDLLLGCQGWRRFAEQDPQKFVQEQIQQQQQQQRAPVFLANSINPGAQMLDADPKVIEKLDQQFVKSAIELQKKLGATEATQINPGEPPGQIAVVQNELEQKQQEVQNAEKHLRELQETLWRTSLGGAMLTLAFLGFFCVSIGMRRLAESAGHPYRWLGAGVGLFVFLFLLGVVGTIALMGQDSRDVGRDQRQFDRPVVQFKAKPGPNVAGNEMQNARLEKVAPVDLEPPPGGPPVLMPQKDAGPGRADMNPLNVDVMHANHQLNIQFPGQAEPVEAEDRRLRREGNYQAILLKALGRRVRMPTVDSACVVREYAHRRLPDNGGLRTDYAATVYWHPVLVMPDGKAEFRFDLSDSVTRFQVMVLSHTFDGRLGADSIEIASRLPFRVEPVTPTEVCDQDRFIIPVLVSNDLPNRLTARLSASAQGLKINDRADREIALPGNEPIRELFHVEPSVRDGEAVLRFLANHDGYRGTVRRRISIVPDGIPVVNSISGQIGNQPMVHTITLPEKWNPGTLKVEAHFFPSALAELAGALRGLQQEPVGEFERVVSNAHLHAMILDYLKEAQVSNPLLEKTTRSRLQTELQRLANLERPEPGDAKSQGGFAWLKQDARPRRAPTAFGVWHVRARAGFHPVEPELLKRTERFLLQNRVWTDGVSGKPHAAPRADQPSDAVTNAYILWVLAENRIKADLDADLALLRTGAKTQKDPYFLALAGLGHIEGNQKAEGVKLLQLTAEYQKETGVVQGGVTGITGSRGRDLDVETTALALLGWLKSGRDLEFQQNVSSAVGWLNQQRRGPGSFGGAHATVLAVKALLAYQKTNPRELQAGLARLALPEDLRAPLELNPEVERSPDVEGRVSFTPRSLDTLTLVLPRSEKLRPGKNVVQLEMTGNNAMPYTLTWSYRVQKPVSDPNAPIQLKAQFDRKAAREGELVKLSAVFENVSGKWQRSPIAILGLPAGVSLENAEAQLKVLVAGGKESKSGGIAAWERRGRELVLFGRDLAPGATARINLDLRCTVPGIFRAPAGRAYSYHDADRKHWIEPLTLQIDPGE